MFIIKYRNIIPQCSALHFHKKLCDLDPICEWYVVEFCVRLLTTTRCTKGLNNTWINWFEFSTWICTYCNIKSTAHHPEKYHFWKGLGKPHYFQNYMNLPYLEFIKKFQALPPSLAKGKLVPIMVLPLSVDVYDLNML